MFEHTSRYANIATAEHTLPATRTPDGRVVEGRTIVYVRRRFLPPPETLPTLTEVLVAEGDRLDIIAAETLGDPEQFWRICDAHAVIDPLELLAEPGQTIRIPIPQA
jgi:hypothetical protein